MIWWIIGGVIGWFALGAATAIVLGAIINEAEIRENGRCRNNIYR